MKKYIIGIEDERGAERVIVNAMEIMAEDYDKAADIAGMLVCDNYSAYESPFVYDTERDELHVCDDMEDGAWWRLSVKTVREAYANLSDFNIFARYSEWVTVSSAASVAKVTPQRIYQLVKSGEVRTKTDSKKLVKMWDVLRWIDESEHKPGRKA